MNKGVYLGRFQPMHLGHVARTCQIVESYPDVELTVGVAGWYGEPNQNIFMGPDEALMVARLSIADAELLDRVRVMSVPIDPELSLEDTLSNLLLREDFNVLFSGSEKTIGAMRRVSALERVDISVVDWGEEDVLLPMRATQIRGGLINGDDSWREMMTPRAAEYIAQMRLGERLRELDLGEKRPWGVEGNFTPGGVERR